MHGSILRRRGVVVSAMATAALACAGGVAVAQNGAADIDDARPAPGSFGTDVPLTYQGPPPSQTKKELIGPLELLRSGEFDLDAGTITLPLYRGTLKRDRDVWYVLTDTSDRDEADSLGLNFSPKLKYGDIDFAARRARLARGNRLAFDNGSVDFAPERRIAPGRGADAFPPSVAQPGSVGSRDYSPLVAVRNTRTVYNAPIVSMASRAQLQAMDDADQVDHGLVHDKVTAIDMKQRTVTMRLTTGFSFARPILYLSTEANDPVAATLEEGTLAEGMRDLTVGEDDGAFSAVERIFIAANGPTGRDNPQRQGLNSAIRDGRSPLNVFGGIPSIATDYSPMWDATIYAWTPEAIAKGYAARNFEEFRILGLAQQGHLTGPDGRPFGSTGIIINCPPAFRLL